MKTRNDAVFNPFIQAQKVAGFAQAASRMGCETFSVYVEKGLLKWSGNIFKRKAPGWIATYNANRFIDGITSPEWTKLETRIAIEMNKQRKYC